MTKTRSLDAVDLDADHARRRRVVADGEDIAAKRRAMGDDRHHRQQPDHDDERRRKRTDVAAPEELDRLGNVGDRDALGQHQVDALVDARHGDRQHQRVQVERGDQEAVDQPEQRAEHDRESHRHERIDSDVHHQHAGGHAAQPAHRAERDVELAEQHQHRLTERDQAGEGEAARDDRHVVRGGEIGRQQRRSHEQEQQDHRDDDQLKRRVPRHPTGLHEFPRVLPKIAVTSSSFEQVRLSNSPCTRPAYRQMMRVAQRRSSSISDEMTMTPMPCSARSLMMR